ncbi:MAG: transketolase family protein [Bacteroides sp.]|nr:transketolase family protein [Bacillota bacterium]MCM1393460.1 transketolase family protein [[Eubacterium] siraeum]MCM1455306.1 transketolase family protein [Bacteroides sp.]
MITDDKEIRQALAQSLTEIAKTDDRIVVLDADLMSCHATKCFKEAYPDRFFNVGIAEQNMIGIAAGMAAMGKIPFTYSFAPFATRRCYDQIFISVAYADLHVKMIGSEPGVAAEVNGGTHMPFEDMALMRAIPKMICFEPTDATMMQKALPEIIEKPSSVYVRMFRKKAAKIYDDSLDFKLGKAITLKDDGGDVTLIASGLMVERALEAAEILAEQGVGARVVNIHTWKPIDVEAIKQSAAKTGAIVTCENHNVRGGLGSAVAEVVVRECPVPMQFVGINDEFGQVGKNAYLSEVYHITANDIVAAAHKAIKARRCE